MAIELTGDELDSNLGWSHNACTFVWLIHLHIIDAV